jgi:hypothetical protein
MNGAHVDLLTESNVIRSLATGAMPSLFKIFNENVDSTFEVFNRPERIAVQADYQDIIRGV